MQGMVEELRRRIAEAGDPERAPRMQAYMKSSMPFRGVTAVPLRRICREVFSAHRIGTRDEWLDAVRVLWDEASYREERYAAIALARHPAYRGHQDPSILGLYRHMVETGAWWDLVDDIASHLVGDLLRAHRDVVAPVMRQWAVDADPWVRRTAILCQLGSKEETDVDLLRFVLEQNLEGSPHGREFFIRKACGWALRQHARIDPGWVARFVGDHAGVMSGLTRREATKHLPG